MGKKKKPDGTQPTFEEMLARLQEIADQLESGQLPLEKAIERYEEGVTCYKECHRILTGAEKKVEILTKAPTTPARRRRRRLKRTRISRCSDVPFASPDPGRSKRPRHRRDVHLRR